MVGRALVWEARVLDPSPEVHFLGDFEKVIGIKKHLKTPDVMAQEPKREE